MKDEIKQFEQEQVKKICVVTGGGSGMGYAAAMELGKHYMIIIAGRTREKLEKALVGLREKGCICEAFVCDVASKSSTDYLARFSSSFGATHLVINAAGLSPHMGTPEKIVEVNALGTINMHNSFYSYMSEGGCLIDISSMSAYLTPEFIMPKSQYRLAFTSPNKFFRKIMKRVNLFPKKVRTGVAYGISKHFIIEYAKKEAARFGERGVRVLSVSPGNFETPMGEAEKDEAMEYIQCCAMKRMGHVEEMAKLLAFCADERLGYLTGTDILCDGGCVASGVNPLKHSIA
ncbi:MAG: SDR family oxidoreductase [Sphaerochaetaceae bacterium]